MIKYPYGIISDVHLHNWSAFSHTNDDGLSNRLQHILDGIKQAGETVLNEGGNTLIITGDLFHTRGVLKPSVLNPAMKTFEDLINKGLVIHAFDGNHDMEGKQADVFQSAIYPLSKLKNFNVYYKPTIVDNKFLFIPWMENPEDTYFEITKGSEKFQNLTVFCHVGLSDVLPGNLGHVINVKDLLRLEFKYVFCGHFHNHVSFDSRVYSVGALTHQSWGDVDTDAGFLIVEQDKVTRHETKAPKFVDVYEHGFDKTIVNGSYVRFKSLKPIEENKAKSYCDYLRTCGALAVLDQSSRPTLVSKDHLKTVEVDSGLETALETFCKYSYGESWEKVYQACLKLKS